MQENYQVSNIQITKTARQALWIVLSCLNPKPESEVIVSSFMCPVVPIAVIKAGCRPVFCDITADGFVMSPEDAARKITPKTIAIVMPYSFGCYSDIESFKRLADDHNLILIEDCAQTFEGRYQNKRLGFNADFGIWSFGISKNIGSLNGGAFWYHEKHKKSVEDKIYNLYSNSEESQNPFELFLAALVPIINKRIGYSISHQLLNIYERNIEVKRSSRFNTPEFNNRMTALEATLCYRQLQRYQETYERRRNNYNIYKSKLSEYMHFPKDVAGFVPDYLYAPVILKKEIRNNILHKFSFVNDINFDLLDKLDILKPFPFRALNRDKVIDEYLLLSIYSDEKRTEYMADKLRLYIKKII